MFFCISLGIFILPNISNATQAASLKFLDSYQTGGLIASIVVHLENVIYISILICGAVTKPLFVFFEMIEYDQLLPAKLMYLLNCFSGAAIWNYIAVYYQYIGYSKAQIGILQTFPPLCYIIGAPLWGVISDRLGKQRQVHYFTILTGGILMFCLRFVTSFWCMCIMICLATIQTAPIGSLLDQTVMLLLDSVGGEYGKQRLYGGIGYGIGAVVTGQVIAMFGIEWMYTIHIVSAIMSMYVLSFIPASAPATGVATVSFAVGMKQLKTKPDLLCLFVLVFFLGLMFGVISSFLTLYLFNLSNGDARIVGIAIFCETASEIPAFFFADTIIRRLGTSMVLLISIIGYFLRLGYYSVMTNPWSALPFEFLHGVTFSLSWAACTNYTYRAASEGTDGMLMGLLSSMLNGYGKGVGTLIGGFMYSAFGPSLMFRYSILGIVFSCISLYCFQNLSTMASSSINLALPLDEDHDKERHLFEQFGMMSPATPKMNVFLSHHDHIDSPYHGESTPLIGRRKFSNP